MKLNLPSGISRHYVFEVHVTFSDPVEIGGLKKRVLKFGGVIFHRSWVSNPGIPYVRAMQYTEEQVKTFTTVKSLSPHQLHMARFERIT